MTYSDMQPEDVGVQAPRRAFTIDDNRVAMCYGNSWQTCNEVKIHNISDWSVVHSIDTTTGPSYDRSGAKEADLHKNVMAVGSGWDQSDTCGVTLINMDDYSTVDIKHDSNVHGILGASDAYFGSGLTISDNYVAFNHIRTHSTDDNTKAAETVIHIHSLDGTYVRTLTPASNYYFRSLINLSLAVNSPEISGDFLIAPTFDHDWSNNMSSFSSAISVYDITSGNLINETVTYDGQRYTPQGSGLFGTTNMFVVSGNSVFDHSQWQGDIDKIPKVAVLPITPGTTIPTFIAPSTTSSTVANKILMWSSDAASYQAGTGRSDVGGVVMTDGDFSNPTTIQLDSPQTVGGGEGKVVTISQHGEINVYNSSTGALEATFTDTLLDNGKASDMWGTANSCAIGAGKIFINSPEHNAAGVGSIIVVDLLDRNVPSFLITPALGNYSRLGNNSNGRVQFIDGKVVAGTAQWSAPDMGIHIFDPDGSNHTFIPTSFKPQRIVKFGDNYVASNSDSGIEILDTSGQVLHSKQVGSYGFGFDLGVTSTNKLVARRHSHQGGGVYEQFVHIYDEGFTNEIIISESAQPSTSGGTTPAAAFWCNETLANSAGFEIFGADILVSAPKASSDTVNESGAIYRYNDSGVLQEIFYGTVASQRLGTDITVGTETTTTTLPAFIPPPYERPDVLDEDSGWVTVSTFSSHDGNPEYEYIQYSSGGTVSYNKSDYNGLTTIKGGSENPSVYSEYNPTKVATKQVTGLIVGETYAIDVDGTFGFANSNEHSYARITVGVTTNDTTGLWRWTDISPLLEAYHITETTNPSGGNGAGSVGSTSPVEFVATSSTYTVVVSKNSSGSGSDFTIEKMEIKRV
jgi:hypothetical protein